MNICLNRFDLTALVISSNFGLIPHWPRLLVDVDGIEVVHLAHFHCFLS